MHFNMYLFKINKLKLECVKIIMSHIFGKI